MMEELNEEHLTGFMKPPAAFIWAHFLLLVSRQAKTFTNSKKKKKDAASHPPGNICCCSKINCFCLIGSRLKLRRAVEESK